MLPGTRGSGLCVAAGVRGRGCGCRRPGKPADVPCRAVPRVALCSALGCRLRLFLTFSCNLGEEVGGPRAGTQRLMQRGRPHPDASSSVPGEKPRPAAGPLTLLLSSWLVSGKNPGGPCGCGCRAAWWACPWAGMYAHPASLPASARPGWGHTGTLAARQLG